MSPRAAAWLAWSLCAFSLALTALSLLLLALNVSHPDAYVYEFWDGDTLVALSFSIIGAIIASRQSPRLALLRGSLRCCSRPL
jgi:hypothetical protein